ncbi:MAG: integrase [Massilia sp.]|nr:integrase [Massilia sp.]
MSGQAPGAARLALVSGVPLLRPEEQVFTAMLGGFANQQLARNLARTTVDGRENTVKAFASYVNAFPWQWSAAMVDEWLGDLRSLRELKRSTIRGYSQAVRAFCTYVTDPAYKWAQQCETRFGTHPIQVVHEWNTAVHVQDNENDPAKRAFTRPELEAFFDHADEQVARIRAFGRKGWLPAFRDAVLLKTAYAYGLFSRVRSMCWRLDFSRLRSSGLLDETLSAATCVVQGCSAGVSRGVWPGGRTSQLSRSVSVSQAGASACTAARQAVSPPGSGHALVRPDVRWRRSKLSASVMPARATVSSMPGTPAVASGRRCCRVLL